MNEALFETLREPGISWAGANPLGEGFCFGSETGRVSLIDAKKESFEMIPRASAAGEAVNGVAFSHNWVAVTTRKDINLIDLGSPEVPEVFTIVGGGLDVTVAPTSGHFVIPLGPDGIMFIKPETGEKGPITICRSQNRQFSFCRVVVLPGPEHDLVVCAGRRGGVGYAEYWDGRPSDLRAGTFSNLDVVDVCSLATPEKPWAVAAACKDGTLILFHDISTDKAPRSIRFHGVKGTVYRVLSTRGDIYLLTSKGLFGLFRLASKFLDEGQRNHVDTRVLHIPLEAADANIVAGRYMLAVGTEDVFKVDVDTIRLNDESMWQSGANGTQKKSGEEPVEASEPPLWGESSFTRTSETLAGARS